MNHFIRYAGIFEVAAVFLVGSLLANVFLQMAGIVSHPFAALTQENPDMFQIGLDIGQILLLQHVGFFLLAIIFTFSQRQHILNDRGFTLSGYSVALLIGIGVVGWAAGDFVNKILWILDAEFELGQAVPWREALFNAEQSPGWWFLLFVGSFGLVPILEEIFWRGYVQSRLQQFLSPTAAIVLTATMFTFSHSQYHHLDLYHISTIIGVFINSLVIGWLFHKTRSLVPVIVMHALLNFPVFGIWSYVVLALMSVVIALYWLPIKQQCMEATGYLKAHGLTILDMAGALLLALIMLSLSQWPTHFMLLAAVTMVLAVIATVWFNWTKIKGR